MSGSPLIGEIDNQCVAIIEELKTTEERLREQDTKLKNVEGHLKDIKDDDLRVKWQDATKRLEIVLKEERNMTSTMVEVKQLFQQKKKFTLNGNECPPEIISKLIDKVTEVGMEKRRIKAELEDIDEDLDDIKNLASGEMGPSSAQLRMEKGDFNSRSKFITQWQYISPESLRKQPKEFLEYLNNYEAELAKGLMHSQPGTADFKEKMFELGKVSEMKTLFVEAQRRKENMLIKGYDPATVANPKKVKDLEFVGAESSGGSTAKIQLKNYSAGQEKARIDERDEELIRLQTKLAKMNETIRGLDQLNKEKEKLAILQREKFELLERDRYELEIARLKAEREKEEAEHLRRLQKMNVELDYIEQLKLKTVGIVSQQIEEFSKIEENRWASKRMKDKEFHQEELNRLQAEFLKREDRRQQAFSGQMKDIEGKYDKALKMIESNQIDPNTLKLLVGKERHRNFMKESGKPLPESDYTDDDSLVDETRYNKEMKNLLKKYPKDRRYRK
jgi:hypothetical protein